MRFAALICIAVSLLTASAYAEEKPGPFPPSLAIDGTEETYKKGYVTEHFVNLMTDAGTNKYQAYLHGVWFYETAENNKTLNEYQNFLACIAVQKEFSFGMRHSDQLIATGFGVFFYSVYANDAKPTKEMVELETNIAYSEYNELSLKYDANEIKPALFERCWNESKQKDFLATTKIRLVEVDGKVIYPERTHARSCDIAIDNSAKLVQEYVDSRAFNKNAPLPFSQNEKIQFCDDTLSQSASKILKGTCNYAYQYRLNNIADKDSDYMSLLNSMIVIFETMENHCRMKF